jgi:hypothetical protein
MLHKALSRCEHVRGINAIFMRPERMLIIAVVIVVIIGIRAPWVGLIIAMGALGWVAYRLQLSYRATAQAESRLRSLRVQARAFVGE